MSELINAGLITRKSGKHFLTSFGKVVYEAQVLMGKTVQCSSKLQAIDSIEIPGFPAAERFKIIDSLIHESEIKEILVGPQRSNNYISVEKQNVYNNELLVSPPTKR